jgi:hypothetical protein
MLPRLLILTVLMLKQSEVCQFISQWLVVYFDGAGDDIQVVHVEALAVSVLIDNEDGSLESGVGGSDDLCLLGGVGELVEDGREVEESEGAKDDGQVFLLPRVVCGVYDFPLEVDGLSLAQHDVQDMPLPILAHYPKQFLFLQGSTGS